MFSSTTNPGQTSVSKSFFRPVVRLARRARKLGFRAHYPQLETKLTARGKDIADIRAKLAPVEAEVRKRYGNFIMAEDDATLESVVLKELAQCQGTLTMVEAFTGGQICARLAHLPGAEKTIRRGVVARDLTEICNAVHLLNVPTEISTAAAEAIAQSAREHTGASHALTVLIDIDNNAKDGVEFAGTVCLAIATAGRVESRRSRVVGGREWVRLGAVEMGLDCLRRFMQGLPVGERIDFEK